MIKRRNNRLYIRLNVPLTQCKRYKFSPVIPIALDHIVRLLRKLINLMLFTCVYTLAGCARNILFISIIWSVIRVLFLNAIGVCKQMDFWFSLNVISVRVALVDETKIIGLSDECELIYFICVIIDTKRKWNTNTPNSDGLPGNRLTMICLKNQPVFLMPELQSYVRLIAMPWKTYFNIHRGRENFSALESLSTFVESIMLCMFSNVIYFTHPWIW